MDEVGSAPRRYGKLIAAATTVIGAVAVGLWQGVGTTLGTLGVTFVQTAVVPGTAATTSGAPATHQVQTAGMPPSSAHPAYTPVASGDRAAALGNDVVRLRTPLSFSGVGKGRDEPGACAAALDDVAEQAARQCRQIVVEQKGASFRLEDGQKECRGCAPLGDTWRCVATIAPQCVVTGEID